MSRSESLGIAQLEFMSAGVPVITSGVGGQSWIVGDGSNGIVLDGPEDAKGAADAITRLADHPRLQTQAGEDREPHRLRYTRSRAWSTRSRRVSSRRCESSRTTCPPSDNMPGDERIIEAWAHKGKKVAATSKRLIVRSAKGGKEVTSILYDDIARIEWHAEAPWALLGIGALATAALLDPDGPGAGVARFPRT